MLLRGVGQGKRTRQGPQGHSVVRDRRHRQEARGQLYDNLAPGVEQAASSQMHRIAGKGDPAGQLVLKVTVGLLRQ